MILLPLKASLQGKPVECIGKPVQKSVIPNDEYIVSGGLFYLKNRSSDPVALELVKLQVCQNDEVLHEPASHYIYRKNSSNELGEPFELNGRDEIFIEVSFPFFVLHSLPLKGYHVKVGWKDDSGNRYSASSELQFELKR